MERITIVLFLVMLVIIATVDLKTMMIPDEFTAALFGIGLLSVVTGPGPALLERLIGMMVVSVPMFLITLWIPGAFGGGDIKLMAASGLLLGWKLNLVAVFLAILTGGLYGSYLLITGKKGRREHFAFGPFLCVGMVIALFWGESLIHWYGGVWSVVSEKEEILWQDTVIRRSMRRACVFVERWSLMMK